jgi:hypothetical protein
MVGTLSGQGGKEFYDTKSLYDAKFNAKLNEAPIIN